MTDIVWRIYNPDAYPGSMKPQTTILPRIVPTDEAADVVKWVVEDYFDHNPEEWRDAFGYDDFVADIRVEIFSPDPIAGHYSVDVDMVVRATVQKKL